MSVDNSKNGSLFADKPDFNSRPCESTDDLVDLFVAHVMRSGLSIFYVQTREVCMRRVPRILIVDDVVEMTELLSLFLGRVGGYETRTATNGLEAIRVAEEFRPDVILLDIAIPCLNGFDTAKRIRSEPWGKATLFIGMSGHSHPKYAQRAREAGFVEYLSKPMPLPIIVDVIEKFLKKSDGGNLGRLGRVGCFEKPEIGI